MKLSKAITLYGALLLIFQSCAVKYSFTGTNINYELVKTFSVENFFNDSGGGPANMEQRFTEAIKEYYQRNTQLELVRTNGDLQFAGAISRYTLTPQAAVSSGDPNLPDRAGLMRLTISIDVEYLNTTNEEENLKRTFSFFKDYDPRTTTLLDVENQLVEEIFEVIIQDIFTATVANW
ncbi:lipopolysaccharide assembly protein [Algoriphagus boseongensis]|uniref:Lipopolysaccharide assembly protein n=1 Tax=Algoriphagus boseongensis TaxID=1442587 RepID=A0A4R6T902_9BACT|nr:LPS assembly lipoprotein LptE [Algoriphagus boseongensis]TDQ19540.1 lipopolysaccharide assembly protein [Algoriphagus boseongensis]